MKTIFKLLFVAASIQSSYAVTFAGRDDIFGCATVVSVRNVAQAPMNDSEYQSEVNGINSTSTFVQVLGGTFVGAVVSVVVGSATDMVVNANREAVPVSEPKGGWEGVKAIKMHLDDGREINLPLMDRPGNYKVGQRYLLGYSKQLDNIQLVFKGAPVPKPGDEPRYSRYCSTHIDKLVADDIVVRSGSLVDESKIIGE